MVETSGTHEMKLDHFEGLDDGPINVEYTSSISDTRQRLRQEFMPQLKEINAIR